MSRRDSSAQQGERGRGGGGGGGGGGVENGEQELVRMLDQAAEPSGEAYHENAYADLSPGSDHLVVMVNGIVGSASDWKFAADLFQQRLGGKVVVHSSTFDGIDVMGRRLADEVQDVVQRKPNLKKISFVAHSLGGLVARYAIARLYLPSTKHKTYFSNSKLLDASAQGTLLGLKPMNFITVATPHLGSRGHKQLPFLLGLRCLEKLATLIAHWFVGTTGKHLFLTDAKNNQPPLLYQMATDCSEGLYLSALGSFKHHVAYANVVNDHMVGWRTSSLRRQTELPMLNHSPINPNYPHIVHMEEAPPLNDVTHSGSQFPTTDRRKSQYSSNDAIEEKLVSKLTRLPWKRVDVWFKGSNWFIAHSAIQVKDPVLHSHGADVIAHLIDNFEA
ncbi:hypothetical protein O6H91_13G058000 [Diphasiastrum complanatum]|uniref:Uncharacterized protein n=1 Tax=Diphasiastrum complanatum TaxID=34168 RepID=A0ACC2BV35_DIPCM|nr:hypothetical protein O6H91_13G058000 [Diphasiastrum complanatum]